MEEAAEMESCNSHVRVIDSTVNSKRKSLARMCSGDIYLLKVSDEREDGDIHAQRKE